MNRVVTVVAGICFFAVLFGLLFASDVQSDIANCDDWGVINQAMMHLKGQYLASFGIGTDLSIFYIFVSDEDQSWTLTHERLGHAPCVLASGADWTTLPPFPNYQN